MAPTIDIIRRQSAARDGADGRRDIVIRAGDQRPAAPSTETRRHYGTASGARSAQR
ncbi:MAG TPA: hypothetical protein VFM97_10635 [Gammaproteobacteria bacterium]|nr:hypothetical protein [Gammaproteobacteria bacterium]